MDGSPETALTSFPYSPNAQDPRGYRGVQVDPTQALDDTVMRHWKAGPVQIAAHVLGDGAIDLLLNAMEKAYKAQGPTTKRHQLQHAAMMRPDQVARIKRLGVAVSFTAGPIYLVGDYITKLYGAEHEGWIMPAVSLKQAGVPWALNTDFPAGAGPSLFMAAHDIVNRATKDGRVLAPVQRASAYDVGGVVWLCGAVGWMVMLLGGCTCLELERLETHIIVNSETHTDKPTLPAPRLPTTKPQALRAMTYSGAYIHNEEKSKGSLEVGKLADLVVVDRNPLKINPHDMMNVRVVETIKEGRSIYKMSPADAVVNAAVTRVTQESAGDGGIHPAPPVGGPVLTRSQSETVAKLLTQSA